MWKFFPGEESAVDRGPVSLQPTVSSNGQAEIPCAFCRGTGGDRFRASAVCPICCGHRTVKVRTPYVSCKFCRGQAVSLTGARNPCIACGGKAVIYVEPPHEVCPNCRGSGGSGFYCLKCHGSGVVTVRPSLTEMPYVSYPEEDAYMANPRKGVEGFNLTSGGGSNAQVMIQTQREEIAFLKERLQELEATRMNFNGGLGGGRVELGNRIKELRLDSNSAHSCSTKKSSGKRKKGVAS